jgi:hypothetical protein
VRAQLVIPNAFIQGVPLPRSSASIKKENIKTCWFSLWNKKAISKPVVLHTSVKLEPGDLFINQFYSEKHQAQVIQVWVLVKGNGTAYTWKQVRDWV